MKKLGFILLLIIPLLLVAETLSFEFQLQIPAQTDGQSLIDAGYGIISQAGLLQLPTKTVNIILPKGARLISHDLKFGESSFVAAASPALNIGFSNGEEVLSSAPKSLSASRISYLGLKKWGEINFASFRVLPAELTAGGYLWAKSISIKLEYEGGTRDKGIIPPTYQNLDFFVNPAALTRWYEGISTRNYDYLIVTSSALYQNLTPLLSFRAGQGLQVSFTDIAMILQSSPGASNQEKLFNYLASEYNAHPFSYLLLVGDVDTVPIGMLTPGPDGSETVPSDYYYSDLSSIWDSDNDGRLGEYSSGEGDQDWLVDFTPEVFVGRISSNNPATITDIVNRTVAFESDNGAWKNKALLPAAFLNYGGEPELIHLQTDGAGLMELMDVSILADMQTSTMYEQEGYIPSYPSDYPLSSTVLKNLFSTESWGLINWSAHGSATSSSRKVWMNDDNGNNLPDSNEMDWMGLVNRQSFDNLVNTDGTVIFAASCYNGMIDSNEASLGEYSLAKKSVATVAATRTGWYKIGWQNPGWGGLSSYNYHWLENYHANQMSVGMASAYTNLLHTQIYLFGDPVDDGGVIYPELQNVYTYLLFGDPAVGYQPQQEAPSAKILIWEPLHHQGLNVQNAISYVGDFNVVYSNRIISDYQYLDQFDAVFCLFGAGDTAYILNPGSMEYNALNSYLDGGGSVYMEGWIGWDNNDSLMNKFGASSPFNHMAILEGIRYHGPLGAMTWSYETPDNYTQALWMAENTPSVPIFNTNNVVHANDVIGIWNSDGNYRTIASSFQLALVVAPVYDIVDMVRVILDTLGVTSSPVSNDDPISPPLALSLKTYPNPFAGKLTIETSAKADEAVELSIYNLRGQKVLQTSFHGAAYTWNPVDEKGAKLGSGIYLVRAQAKSSSGFKRVLLLK